MAKDWILEVRLTTPIEAPFDNPDYAKIIGGAVLQSAVSSVNGVAL